MNAFVDPIDQAVQAMAAQAGFPLDSLTRLALAMVAGGLVGLEREIRGRQAGFRTNLLVCLGSALVMIVSINFSTAAWPQHSEFVNVTLDPARIAYGVMSGIGFLGAGAILKQGASVRGLTTAAGLWCVAALGLSAGFGLYIITIIAAGLVVGSLWLLDYVEEILPRVRYRTIVVRRTWSNGCIAESVNRLKTFGVDVGDVSFERSGDLSHVDISLQIAFTRSRQYYRLEREIADEPDYELVATRETS